MPGIAGIAGRGKRKQVGRMLDKIAHRGGAGRKVIETSGATLGAVWPAGFEESEVVQSAAVLCRVSEGRFAEAHVADGKLVLGRDALGVEPLYHGRTADGDLCFASEVKALLEVTQDVNELMPGTRHDGERTTTHYRLGRRPLLNDPPETMAREVRSRLERVVRDSIGQDPVGAWLSGGLDSSAIAAIARRHVRTLHTVTAGVAGAPDVIFARETAAFLKSEHHEVIATVETMLSVLPEVIYHLESFDALLVRSSIMNYLVGREMARYAPEAFSGEGGDELFGGYHYLKGLDHEALADELIDITGRLHNTALQRVDRSGAAAGLIVHVPLAFPEIVEYAMMIPAEYKIRDGVEKWILRQAVAEDLPASVVSRPKAKFWEGAGVSGLLSSHAEEVIADGAFERERVLPNGWLLNSKEELLFYRIFKEQFGEAGDLSWMGRTKGVKAI